MKDPIHIQVKCIGKLNWPILDSMLVKILRILRANSSAKALFLATATPSAGSSNLCSTQACHITHNQQHLQLYKDVFAEEIHIKLREWEVTWSIMPSKICPSSLSSSFSNGFSLSSGMENFPGLWCTDFNNLWYNTNTITDAFRLSCVILCKSFQVCVLVLTFYTSSSVLSVYRDFPWFHQVWEVLLVALQDAHTQSGKE